MKLADLRPFDVINHLRDEEDIMGYLQAVMEENHPKATAAALHDVARARRQLHLTTPFDPADYLTDEAHTAAYLQMAAEEAAENGDNSILLDAIQTAAKARGMAGLAKAAGIPRDDLYTLLDEAPALEALHKLLAEAGITPTTGEAPAPQKAPRAGGSLNAPITAYNDEANKTPLSRPGKRHTALT